MESGLKRPMGNELCRRLHPNDSRNPFSFTVAPQGVIFGDSDLWKQGCRQDIGEVIPLPERNEENSRKMSGVMGVTFVRDRSDRV